VVVRKLKSLLTDRRGSEAVSFLLTTAMLLFATIMTAFVYISQSYNAAYLCRKVTRQIEVTGEYDRNEVNSLLSQIDDGDLQNLEIEVIADYFAENRIQLCEDFTVKLTADYKIKIVQVGSKTLELRLPIRAQVGGMSETYYK